MSDVTEQSQTLTDVFNAAGSHFDEVTPHVWGPAGVATVDALALSDGESVLDVCSGTGASALPAAVQVGPTGRVVAVDLASDLLAMGRATAERMGLSNIEFRTADATTLGIEGEFDALSCAFGVFFLPSMDASVESLLRALRPGGRFAFTVWHRDALYDFTTAFFAAADAAEGKADAEPAEPLKPHPITRIDSENKIRAWATSLGAVDVGTSVTQIRVPCSDDFCWDMVLGSGLRGRLLGKDDAHIANVRSRFLGLLAERDISEIRCDSLIVRGRIPGIHAQ